MKLAIVGAEPQTRDNAPWDDSDYDIWAISNWAAAGWMKRCTAVVEVHKPELYRNHPKDPTYWTWLKNTRIPVYMQTVDDGVPASIEYPLREVLSMLPIKVKGLSARPLNSSIAYAIGLAILQGYEEIDLYGIEMASSSEYRSQQPIFSFWVGFAAGRDIDLNINCTDKLFIQPLYGYEETMNNDKIHSYISGMKEQQAELLKQSNMLEGALALARQLVEE